MDKPILDQIEEAVFYKRREYLKDNKEVPFLTIILSYDGKQLLLSDERLRYSSCLGDKNTILGYPCSVRPEQSEAFKIIER